VWRKELERFTARQKEYGEYNYNKKHCKFPSESNERSNISFEQC